VDIERKRVRLSPNDEPLEIAHATGLAVAAQILASFAPPSNHFIADGETSRRRELPTGTYATDNSHPFSCSSNLRLTEVPGLAPVQLQFPFTERYVRSPCRTKQQMVATENSGR
jgi:hypothetical protein